MAIKWKNNKNKEENKEPKQWQGFLLIGIFILILTFISGIVYEYIEEVSISSKKQWESENKEREEQQKKNKEKIELEYLSDDEKMSLVSNIYYLDYKLNHMYNGVSVTDYLLKDNKQYETSDAKQKSTYQQIATKYMNTIYSIYHMDYSVKNMETYTYMEKAGVSVGVQELSKVDSKKGREELQEKYNSYLVIDYDKTGTPKISAYNVDTSKFANYLSSIKLQAVIENFSDRGMAVYSITTDDSTRYSEQTGEVVETDGAAISETEQLAATEEAVEETSTMVNDINDTDKISIDFPTIKSTKVVIGFMQENSHVYYSYQDNEAALSYLAFLAFCIILFIGAVVIQNISSFDLRQHALFQLPTELLTFINIMVAFMVIVSEIPYIMMEVEELGVDYFADAGIAYAVASAGRYVAFLGVYWLIGNCLPYILHPIKQIKEHSICVKIAASLKRKCVKLVKEVTSLNPDKGLKKNIFKLVIANVAFILAMGILWVLEYLVLVESGADKDIIVVVLLLFSVLWLAIYVGVLYVFLIRKGSVLEQQYKLLLSMSKNMAQGNLDAGDEVKEDLGIFEPVKCELSKVREGFSHAVEKEVRSQNMKTELITNVSHDLKTPLTAIITYVDLLKDETITEETRREYINTLDKKSQRLKVLIEDLFEVSKANTNNITLHYADMDLCNLIKQVRLENEEKIMNSDLVFRWNLPEEKCMVRLDPQKTYRIIENLLTNALKYSMSGSRVYGELQVTDTQAIFTMKNISATEMNFEPEKLTERFVRGDVSRNTEGSGLGLAIVRSFTEVQNGTFTIEIDGDLFKAVVKFNKFSNGEARVHH